MFRFSDAIDSFHQSVSDAVGLDDFGVDDYREGLSVLCRSLDEDASLSEVGEFAFQGMIVDALAARLRVEEGWKRHPELGLQQIARPIVIVGLPRTGTTALHHLMAQDPGLQSFEHWLQRAPQPRPRREAWNADADYQASATRLEQIYAQSPDMRAIHEVEADRPDECWNVFAQNFSHGGYEANADVRRYAEWWATCDMRPVYARHRRTAQLIGASEPERRWLFKDATHLFNLDAMLGEYPDALIVQTHRDPVELIPSVCSLCWASRSPLNEGVDPKEFGAATLALWERSIQQMMRARESLDPAQFYDLHFRDFVLDPIAEIEKIYAEFELPFTEEAREGMIRFRKANPKGKHGEHRYSAQQWGLEPAEIAERFRTYSERYCGL